MTGHADIRFEVKATDPQDKETLERLYFQFIGMSLLSNLLSEGTKLAGKCVRVTADVMDKGKEADITTAFQIQHSDGEKYDVDTLIREYFEPATRALIKEGMDYRGSLEGKVIRLEMRVDDE